MGIVRSITNAYTEQWLRIVNSEKQIEQRIYKIVWISGKKWK